ncbi:MAG: hypothetical protein CMB80_12395 [Flammeovirgaceae bacterium]|nr:hypothetical protein [Flammeovirgaceae bacterium]
MGTVWNKILQSGYVKPADLADGSNTNKFLKSTGTQLEWDDPPDQSLSNIAQWVTNNSGRYNMKSGDSNIISNGVQWTLSSVQFNPPTENIEVEDMAINVMTFPTGFPMSVFLNKIRIMFGTNQSLSGNGNLFEIWFYKDSPANEATADQALTLVAKHTEMMTSSDDNKIFVIDLNTYNSTVKEFGAGETMVMIAQLTETYGGSHDFNISASMHWSHESI